MKKVAIIGHGVVGSGVSEVLLKKKEQIYKKTGEELEVKYILDLRDFPDSPIPVIHDFDIIEKDEEIAIVVETMGGVNPAYEYTKRLLLSGKDVVTSNKELVAQKGAELIKIAKENNRNYMFEASVGGGIPIIRPLYQCLEANDFYEISGILNGTTNFILTKMINDGFSFDEALSMAQKLGYAEKNPSADVDGFDTCRKICILASLVYGVHIYPDEVHTEGIRDVNLIDVQYASSWSGRVIKLIGKAKKSDNGKLSMIVCPMIIRDTNLLTGIEDVYNGVLARGDLVGDVIFYGKGAGSLPTASAVVADVIDCAKHFNDRKAIYWEEAEGPCVSDYLDEPTKMYFRVSIKNKEDIDRIREEFGDIRVLSRKNAQWSEFAFVTSEEIAEREILNKIDHCNVQVDAMIRVESD